MARPSVYGTYVDELLAIVTGSGGPTNTKYVHANHLYSVAALTDNSGAVVERYRYDAYGQRTVLAPDGATIRASSSYGNQIGFTGRFLDKETGLWYFRARYYSGSLGRFVNRDPLGYEDGANLYAAYYVPNDLDPSGEITVEAGANFGEKIIAAGPLAAGVGWKLSVGASGNSYTCNCKCWAKTELAISFSIVGGGAFKGLKPVKNPRGSRYRDAETGRFAKGPKGGDSGGPSGGAGGEAGEDCSTGVFGGVEFKASAQAGIVLVGIACDASCTYTFGAGWSCSAKCIGGVGIAGAEVAGTISGKLTIVGPCGKPFELLEGLSFGGGGGVPPPNDLGFGRHYGVGMGGGGFGM